jgi:hypothetical protein
MSGRATDLGLDGIWPRGCGPLLARCRGGLEGHDRGEPLSVVVLDLNVAAIDPAFAWIKCSVM